MSFEECRIGDKAPVFTEQVSAASQMTAAKVMDIIPDCQLRKTSSRRSIRLHPVQNGRCTDVVENPKSEGPDSWTRLPKHKWPKSWSNMEDPIVPLERNMYGHPSARLLCEKQFEKILLKYGWEKIPNSECFRTSQKTFLLSGLWMTSNWLERNKILILCGKYSIKKSIWENNIIP